MLLRYCKLEGEKRAMAIKRLASLTAALLVFIFIVPNEKQKSQRG